MDQIEKKSDTELTVTKTVVRTIKLVALVSRRAAMQLQIDLLNQQLVDLDSVITEAKKLGIVEVAPVAIAPVTPVTPDVPIEG